MEKLKEKGWNLTEVGFSKLTDNGKQNDVNFLIKLALNTDLRDVGHNILPAELKGSKYDLPAGGVVVQVTKVRNVAAPRANEESKTAPRLLRIHFSDGQGIVPGIEYESLPQLSLNTVPGTKVLLKNGPIAVAMGNLLLKPANVELLGGHVEALAEKWEISRTMAKFAKGGARGNSAAPPWIPFGQKIDTKAVDCNIKSLTNDPEKETAKENVEFNAQRSEAIAEASKAAAGKKVFGGGQKMMDHNVQKIVDKGFSEEDAHYALKINRNDLGRAIRHLKRQTGDEERREERPRRGGRGGFGRNGFEGGGEEGSAKPSGKISLFDFLETKLPGELAAESLQPQYVPPPSYRPDMRRQYPMERGGRRQAGDFRRPPREGPSSNYGERRRNAPRGGSLAGQMESLRIDERGKQDFNKAFPQIPNGFDPNRIMGFQNKETNEFARNVLKQQHQRPHPPPQREAPTGLWQWRVGDKCLAKYWEDGKYYNAEVTGVTEKTCVVAFLDYGNYEEVLKDDCLPVTMEGDERGFGRQQFGGGRPHRHERQLYAPPRK
ncbi:tudor domain-containing protein 3 [Phlebotomus argentipes]|uniref:tudor domain-containing protein 3 n=1 Tax=Phlebotomus argentipes TaxID=94469 RepID=UPI002893101A|nr:tudor domain-containing protein 3 [Phlebotomus argentipes]